MADSSTESDSILREADCSAIGTVISTLPTQRGWTTSEMKLYQGFWHMDYVVPGILSLQESFRGNPDQIVLTTYPKSGTTWLKALLVSIMNRSSCNFTGQGQTSAANPLVSSNPHGFVPIMEFHAASNFADPNAGDGQRLLGTHLPYSLLPKSMIESGCKIVHVMREPKDVFVSLWHFACKLRKGNGLPPLALDDAFDRFCDGFSECGPYWDYEIEYYNESLKNPGMIFITTYEDLMERPDHNVRKIASFVGQPFTAAEEERGVAEGIVSFCSFDKLSNLPVNRTETTFLGGVSLPVKIEVFFRNGKVGDWKNYLNDEMRERIDCITRQKFQGTGLLDYLVTFCI